MHFTIIHGSANFERRRGSYEDIDTIPAAQVILMTLKEAQRRYADMRGIWSVKCLEGQGRRLVARAETMDPLGQEGSLESGLN